MGAITVKLPYLSTCGEQVESNGASGQFVGMCWIQVYHQARAAFLPGFLVSQTDVNYFQKHYLSLTGYLHIREDDFQISPPCMCVGSVIERKGTQGEVGKVDRDHLFRLMSRATLSKPSQQRMRSSWAHAIQPPHHHFH